MSGGGLDLGSGNVDPHHQLLFLVTPFETKLTLNKKISKHGMNAFVIWRCLAVD